MADFTNIQRNYDKVALESYRRKVDAKFNEAHDELSDAYYNFWKKGLSKPWKGFDAQSSLEESKILFDKLHGLLWHKHLLALKAEHDQSLVKEEKFDVLIDQAKLKVANDGVEVLKSEGIEFEV